MKKVHHIEPPKWGNSEPQMGGIECCKMGELGESLENLNSLYRKEGVELATRN